MADENEVMTIFNKISKRYDFLNDLFSFGMHRIWKKKLLSFLNPLPGEKWLDLCCGTGDLSFALAKLVNPKGEVIGLDFAIEPLKIAKKYSLNRSVGLLSWVQSDALNTGLSANEFDGIVMAYGLRNVSSKIICLKEMYRLLKPGGSAGILDFNPLNDSKNQKSFQLFYLRNFVVPVSMFFGMNESYSYIEQSLKDFPSGYMQKKLALEACFSKAKYYKLAFGQMGILLLKK